ncbi:MAG TPA: reverse transcriptase family protein [Jatrophihabitans sp.]|nr:reverse transcriptase family protein [Jatrophihabitans sp.]
MNRSDQLASGLATALLAGSWTRSQMTRRARSALGLTRVPPWLARLVADVAAAYRDAPADRPRELAAFLQATPAWSEALGRRAPRSRRRGARRSRVVQWTPAPTRMVRRPWPVTELPDVAALARLLDVDQGELCWFADVRGWERTCAPALRHYRWTPVPKRDGIRLLAAPKSRLKEIQRRLLRHVLAPIPVHDAAHGGVTGRSIRTATEPHTGTAVVLRFDLEAFFASIAAARVWGLLRAAGLPEAVAHTITGLLTTVAPLAVSRDPRLATPHLPPGAPTSPRLANLIAYRLDRRLAGLATAFGARYTRYVDDLTFSGDASLRTGRFGDLVDAIVRAEGFALNNGKTVIVGAADRQRVLGAVVNVHPAVPRADRDLLRATLHNCVTRGWATQAAGRSRDEFRDHLLGRVAWVGSVHQAHGRRLRTIADRIDWD